MNAHDENGELAAIHALAMNPQDTEPKEGDPYTLALLKQLLAARSATREPSIPLSEITAQILHIKLNGVSLAKFGGQDADEGRCRELCAMYLAEFIQCYHMGERLKALDLNESSVTDRTAGT